MSEAKALRPEFKTWTGSEVRTFLDAVAGDQYYALWHFMVATGVRRGEALGLRWADVDWERSRVNLRQTVIEERKQRDGQPDERLLAFGPLKGGRSRPVVLDAGTLAVLQDHRSRQTTERVALGDQWVDNDLVFCRGRLWLRSTNLAGTALDPERISEAFRRDVSRASVPLIRLHDLRHTWATLALASGDVHPKVVQERLGHSNISITLDIYSHVVDGMDASAAATVAALFAPVRSLESPA